MASIISPYIYYVVGVAIIFGSFAPPSPAPLDRSPWDALLEALLTPDALRAVALLCIGYFGVHFLLSVGA